MTPATEPNGTSTRGAVVLAACWGAALALLAWVWSRSPVEGLGHALLVWSVPTAPLAAFTWQWLRQLSLRRFASLPSGGLLVIAVVWAALAACAVIDPGAEWILDGLVLRRPLESVAGHVARWTPLVWGFAVSTAGLAAALEARYHLARSGGPQRDADRAENETPPPFGGGVGPAR